MITLVNLWGPVVACMAAIFYVSSLPHLSVPQRLAVSGHSLAYLGLSIVVTRALAGGLPRRIRMRVAVRALLVTLAYAASDEIHQSFVPGRFAELGDLLVDAAGAAIGIVACWAWGIIATVSEPTRGSSR